MHIGEDLVPFHREAAPVGAEDGVRGVVQVGLGVVGVGGPDGLRVVAEVIALHLQGQLPQAPGIGRQLPGVVRHGGHGSPAPEQAHAAQVLGGVEAAEAGLDIRDGPADLGRGHLQPEAIPGLQQHGGSLHQTLPHRPVGGLAEVAPLGVLEVGLARRQSQLHIRNGRADGRAQVFLFGKVGQDQTLPVAIQLILAAGGGKHQAAAPGQGLQQQVHLCVVAQGLVVAHALHGAVDGLLIQHPALAQLHRQVEAIQDQAFQHLRLHLAHEAHGELLQAGIPAQAQHGILGLQLPQLGQHQPSVCPGGQADPVVHHRLQDRADCGGLHAEALAVPGGAQPHHSADLAGEDLLRGGEASALIAAQLGGLFLQSVIEQAVPDPERPARHLQMGEPDALGVVGDLKHTGSELLRPEPGLHQSRERIQKCVDPLQLQAGAEEAGEDLPGRQHIPQGGGRDGAVGEVFLHGGLGAHGQSLVPLGVVRGEIHHPVPQLPAEAVQQLGPAAAGKIHFGDKQHRGDLIVHQQPPKRPGVGLDAVRPADHQNGVIQHLEHPLRLGGEIHMARGVQQGQLPAAPLHMGLGGEDRDAPLPLQGVVVHGRVAVIHPPQAPQQAAAVEDGLRQGGLPRVHVGQEAHGGTIHIIHKLYPFIFTRNPVSAQSLPLEGKVDSGVSRKPEDG